MIYDVKDGLPDPAPVRATGLTETMRKLKVGQYFDYQNTSPHGPSNARTIARRLNIDVIARRTDENTVRIYRVPKEFKV